LCRRLKSINPSRYLVRKINYLLFISLYLSVGNFVFGQKNIAEKYSIKQYTDENGLPQNSIKGVSSDSDGFIWLATEDGLTRFDGRQFYTFNKSSLGISNNRFFLLLPSLNITSPTGLVAQKANRQIYAVVDGNEFVRINNGSAVRDSGYYDHKIKPYVVLKGRNQQTFFSAKLPDYLLDIRSSYPIMINVGYGTGSFYICDTNSIQYFSQNKKKFETAFQRKKGGDFFLIADKLYHFNEGIITHINGSNNTSFILSGDILNHPAYKATRQGIQVYWNNASDQVYFYLDKNLYALDPFENGKVNTRLLIEDFDFTSRNIQSIHVDKESQTVFLGSLTQGLFVLTQHPFESLTTPGDAMENVFYAQIAYDKNSVLTPGGILIGKDINDKIFSKKLPALQKTNPTDKRSLLRDVNGFIWVKAGERLIKMDQKAEKVVRDWLLDDEIKHIFQGKTGLIWLGMATTGLYSIDPAASNPVPIRLVTDLKVTYMESESRDNLLIGTTDGVYSLYIPSKKLTIKGGTKGLYVKSIYSKGPDELWLTAAEYGVMHYGKGKLTAFPMDANHYLASPHCLLDDENGFFWITTNKGLFQMAYRDLKQYVENESAIVKNKNSLSGSFPSSQLFYNYYTKDQGFNTNEFNGGCQPCAIKLPNGYVSLPSLNGLVWFKPENVKAIVPNGNIILDKVIVNLETLPLSGDTIKIPHNSVQAKFYFSTPFYGNAYSMNLSYALVTPNHKVRQSDWIPLKSEDFSITFTNLNSGNYILYVRKMNGFGTDNYTIKKISLIIPPAWYQTWWASSVFALFVIAGIYSYNKMRLYRIERENRRLELKIVKRTRKLNRTLTDLEASKTEVSRQLHMMSRLLTSMTHDIQTPLNYIALTAGFIPDLIAGKDFEEIGEIGRLITNSSQSMSSLLKDLLDYIKANVYSKSLKFDEVNIKNLIENKLSIFESANELKHNKIFNLIPESLIVNSDYQMLAIIIHNLIDNATKFTENGMLTVSSKKIQDKVHVIFSNNGTPISEELLNMFNEDAALNNTSTIGRKTGLGFLIVKEIASLIHVQLTVNQTETTNFHLIFDGSL